MSERRKAKRQLKRNPRLYEECLSRKEAREKWIEFYNTYYHRYGKYWLHLWQ